MKDHFVFKKELATRSKQWFKALFLGRSHSQVTSIIVHCVCLPKFSANAIASSMFTLASPLRSHSPIQPS